MNSSVTVLLFIPILGSPEYWRQVKNHLLAMNRSLGPPTWFLTLSAAEFHWEDMSSMLRIMNSDLSGVDRMRASKLCAIDPVMCQTHFHHRFVSFFNEVILAKDGTGPLGVIDDYFWRIEYQSRGV